MTTTPKPRWRLVGRKPATDIYAHGRLLLWGFVGIAHHGTIYIYKQVTP